MSNPDDEDIYEIDDDREPSDEELEDEELVELIGDDPEV